MKPMRMGSWVALAAVLLVMSGPSARAGQNKPPAVVEATLSYAPDVPPPIERKSPATVVVHLDAGMKTMPISGEQQYA